MRLIRLILALAFCTVFGTGAIAFVASSSGGCTATTATCASSAVTIASGNTIIVVYAIRTTTSTGNAPTVAGNTFTQITGCANNNSSTVRVECWSTTVNGSATITATAINCNLSASARFVCSFAAYSGVVALGRVTVGTQASANPVSPTFNTDDANDWCVGAYAAQGTGTFTTLTGNLRNSGVSAGTSTTAGGGAIADQTQASAGAACTNSETNADTVWSLAAVELRTASTPIKTGSPSEKLVTVNNASGLGAHFGTPSEPLTVAETQAGLGTHFGARNENLAVTEAKSGLGAHFGTVSDIVVPALTASGLGTHFGATKEPLSVSLTQIGLGTHFAVVNDSVVPYVQSALVAGRSASAIDTLFVQHTVTQLGTHYGLASEAVVPITAASGLGTHFRTTSDGVVYNDGTLGLGKHFASLNESLLIAESRVGTGTHFTTTSDAVGLIEVKSGLGTHLAAVSDIVLNAVATAGLGAHFGNQSENLIAYISSSSLGAHFGAVLDSTSITDIGAPRGTHLAVVNDGLTIADNNAGLATHFATSSDTTSAFASTGSIAGHFILAAESFILRELPLRAAAHFGAYTEPLASADLGTGVQMGGGSQSFFVSISESVGTFIASSGAAAHFVSVLDKLTAAGEGIHSFAGRVAVAAESLRAVNTSAVGFQFTRGTLENLMTLSTSLGLGRHFANMSDLLLKIDTIIARRLFSATAYEVSSVSQSLLSLRTPWNPVVEPGHGAFYGVFARIGGYIPSNRTGAYPKPPTVSSYPKQPTFGAYPNQPRKAVVRK